MNGVCTAGSCACFASWRGHNCQYLALEPVPKEGAGYGWAPNITSWGGSIYHNATDPEQLFHLYVTEETEGKGLNSWVSNSQIIHAVSRNPLGPYEKKDVVSKPPTTNPQVLYDPSSGKFLLFHIRGGGSFQLFVSPSVNGVRKITFSSSLSFSIGILLTCAVFATPIAALDSALVLARQLQQSYRIIPPKRHSVCAVPRLTLQLILLPCDSGQTCVGRGAECSYSHLAGW